MSFKKDLSKIRKLNNRCADCNSVNPSWASVNIGILVCQRCCIYHRKMGVHISRIKSIILDNWNSKYINHLKQNGNIKMNKIYEAKLDKHLKPNNKSSDNDLYEFIKNKYEHKLYFSHSIKKKLEKNLEKNLEKKLEKKKITQTTSILPTISPNKNDDKIVDLIDLDSLFISDNTRPVNNENLNIWETFDDLGHKNEIKNEIKDKTNQPSDIEKITSLFKSSQYSWQQPNFYRQNTYPVQQNQQPNSYRQNTYPVQQNTYPVQQNTYPVQQNQNITSHYIYPSTSSRNHQNNSTNTNNPFK